MLTRIARPIGRTRTGYRPPVRGYALPARKSGQTQEVPNIKDVLSRKSFKEAWQGLTRTQRITFGLFVGLGGIAEYYVLKKYILDPVKRKKEEREREELGKELATGVGMGVEPVMQDGTTVGEGQFVSGESG
ncbi:hypothetical protein IAU60_004100 [Kwoniella sp. DSM 27419]